MAGLGLADAVRNYQEGVQFSQQQQVTQAKLGEMRRKQDQEQEERAAAGAIEEASRAEHAKNSPQGPYRPNDETMFAIGDAISNVRIKRGDLEGYAANEARLQAHRQRVRRAALQQFAVDGDEMALFKRAIPSLVPGARVQGIEMVGGASQGPATAGPMPAESGAAAAPAAPASSVAADAGGRAAEQGGALANEEAPDGPPGGPLPMRQKMDAPARSVGADKVRVNINGKMTKPMPIKDFVEMLRVADLDPAASAKSEMEFKLKAAMHAMEQRGKLEVEGVKHEGAKELQGMKDKSASGIRAEQDAAAMARTREQGATSRAVAGTAAAASRYGADKRVEAAKEGAGGKKGSDTKVATERVKLRKAVNDEVTRFMGTQSNMALSGGRISDEDTDEIVDQLMKAYDEDGADPARNITAAVAGKAKAKAAAAAKPGKK